MIQTLRGGLDAAGHGFTLMREHIVMITDTANGCLREIGFLPKEIDRIFIDNPRAFLHNESRIQLA